MKQNLKRVLTLSLAALMLFATLMVVGCDNIKDPNDETKQPTTGGPSDGTGTGSETTPPDTIYDELPTGNYGEYELTILQYDDKGAQFSVLMDIEEDEGTLINSALWNRTIYVESRLNVEISLLTCETTSDVSDKITADITAGDCNYDLFSNHSAHLANQVLNGQAISFAELEVIDITKPWWNQEVIESTALGNGEIYMGFGHINMSCYDAQCALFFNKSLVDEYQLGDVYGMVDAKEWTMDKFITICRNFAQNGENLYGVGAYPYVGAPGLIYGCNVDFYGKNAEGQLEYLGLTDKMYDVYSKMGAMLLDKTVANLDWATYFPSFATEEELFLICNISGMKYFRNEKVDYGVAPFPMYNEEQDGYLSYTTNQLQGVCVSFATKDVARAATIMENLAAESYKQMNDVYFDQLLNERLLRDDKSKKVLAMIFETPLVLPVNAVYDLGLADNIFAFDGGDLDIASRVEACRSAVDAKLKEFYGKT